MYMQCICIIYINVDGLEMDYNLNISSIIRVLKCVEYMYNVCICI